MNRFCLLTLPWVLILSAACFGPGQKLSPISRSIVEQLTAEENTPVDLSQVGPDTWQRVCILGPYADNSVAAETLGFAWDLEQATALSESDGISVLVFIRDPAEVVAYTEHPRNKGDFADIAPQCFDREQAQFKRQVSQDGWLRLVAE